MAATLILFAVLYNVTADEQSTTYEANKAAAILKAQEEGLSEEEVSNIDVPLPKIKC